MGNKIERVDKMKKIDQEIYFFERLLFTAEMFTVFANDLTIFAKNKLTQLKEEDKTNELNDLWGGG